MNHPFIPSIHNGTTCAKCKKSVLEHSDKAECEVCGNVGLVDLMYGSILMCQSCFEKERDLAKQNTRPEIVAARLNQARLDSLNQALSEARQVDESIKVSSDLFNADTIAIVERKKLIDANNSIENKPYFLAEELLNQFRINTKVIFEKNDELIKLNNQQKAIQVYLNNLANQLRQEEREKLKIQDINYKPEKPQIKRQVSPRTSPKLDMSELRRVANEIGVSVMFVQQFVVSKGISPDEAGKMIRASIESAKQSSSQ